MSVWLSYESAVGRIARFWGGDGSVTGGEGGNGGRSTLSHGCGRVAESGAWLLYKKA